MKKNNETCGSELGFLNSVKLGIKGCRTIVCVDFLQLAQYADSTAQAKTPKQVYNLFKTMDTANASGYAKDDRKIFMGTYGPGDIVFFPAGWCFYEQLPNADAMGVRIMFAHERNSDRFEDLKRYLLIAGKENQLLSSVSDLLNNKG